MTERSRTTPSAAERNRALPSAQRLLPLDAVDQSDGAYLLALEECRFPAGVATIARWVILDGRRDAGKKRLAVRTQRQLAQRLGLSASTVCESLRRLRASGLLAQADGDFVLDLSLLVSLSEVAATRRAAEDPPADPEAAFDCLSARPRSWRSGALGDAPVSVREDNTYPVSVPSESVSVPRGCGGIPTAAERGERDGCLKNHPAWQALQLKHFRPQLDLPALRACWRAAVDADLFDADPAADAADHAERMATVREQKVRFLATAFDLANSAGVKSPAVCLRVRVEKQACWRISPEGAKWAKRWVFPEYANEPRAMSRVEC